MLVSVSFALSLLCLVAGQQSTNVVHTFADPDVENLNLLVVDKYTGEVFACGANNIYELSPDLDLIVKNETGPQSPPTGCSGIDCPTVGVSEILRLPSHLRCVKSGTCTFHSFQNTSDIAQTIQHSDAASDANGTKMVTNVNYIHGFSNEGFGFLLTTQPKNTGERNEFVSRMVRVCNNDRTEVIIDCTNESTKYNLLQSAYVSNVGSDLATELGITPRDDVLFAIFLESNLPSAKSALCIYSLKAIQTQFTTNSQNCTAGHGETGSDSITSNPRCIPTTMTQQYPTANSGDVDVNSSLGSGNPISASPILSFDEHLTAVAAKPSGNDTVIFVGTNNGHLVKVFVESMSSAVKYADLEIDQNSPVLNMDFNPHLTYLYVMTNKKVSKVELQTCSVYNNCSDCLAAKDPTCGWCTWDNKCGLKNECPLSDDSFTWITHKGGRCPIPANVPMTQAQNAPNKCFGPRCTRCVEENQCEWCVYEHSCKQSSQSTCANDDITIIQSFKNGANYRIGKEFCPRMHESTPKKMLIPDGTTKVITINVNTVGELMKQVRFECFFLLEKGFVIVNGRLLGDQIYCDETKFSYTSRSPDRFVVVGLRYGKQHVLDNPSHIHIMIYRCSSMAGDRDKCLAIDDDYQCGWCENSNTCEIRDNCDTSRSLWIHKS